MSYEIESSRTELLQKGLNEKGIIVPKLGQVYICYIGPMLFFGLKYQ